jgi:hypothetical protein
MKTRSSPTALHSLETIRTIKQNVNLRGEPFVVVGADDVVVFSGWMFDSASTNVPRVFARLNGASIPATRARRGDVAAAFGERAGQAGFAVAVAIGAFGESLLDIELVYEAASGGLQPFDGCRVVVFRDQPVERSDAIVIDGVQDLEHERLHRGEVTLPLGIVLGVLGWGYAADSHGTRFSTVAIVVGGRVFQGAYGISREQIRGGRSDTADVGYFAQVPSLRLGAGTHELRARLFSRTGEAIESQRGLAVRLDRDPA